MPTFKYDLPAMSDFIGLLDRSIQEITAHCDDVKATVASVLEHYQGPTAESFAQFHDRWQTAVVEHLESLKAYASTCPRPTTTTPTRSARTATCSGSPDD
jgi:uncharacterized protein YukE